MELWDHKLNKRFQASPAVGSQIRANHITRSPGRSLYQAHWSPRKEVGHRARETQTLPLGSVRHHYSVRKQNQGEGCGSAGQSGGSLLHLQQGTWVQECDEAKEGPRCGSVTKPT